MTQPSDHHGTAAGQWRAATSLDVPRMIAVAEQVHAAYPEDEAVFAERLRLYPAGCRVLAIDGKVVGYIISHPWRLGEPPLLNARLGVLPAKPDTYYLHDIALLSEARGAGAGSVIVSALAEQARTEGLPTLSLVAVHNTVEFWQRLGFAVVEEPALAAKLASYDRAARFMVRWLR